MIGPYLHARPHLPLHRERRQRDVAESAHAHFSERDARSETANRVDACVDDASPVRQRLYGEAELLGASDAIIGDRPCALVHVQIDHGTLAQSRSASKCATAAAGAARAASVPKSLRS